jgi:hypothetical protein
MLQEARDLLRNRAQLQLPDPFADGVSSRIRELRPLLTDAPILDPRASLRVCCAVKMDTKSIEAVNRYGFGRLVVLAKTDADCRDELYVLEEADKEEKKMAAMNQPMTEKERAELPRLIAKNWSKRKCRANRFFDLCQGFPAALGIDGVWKFCQEAGWTKILRECFAEKDAEMERDGLQRTLKVWPAWARPPS